MPFRIVRNDITKMHTEAIVNTANEYVSVGTGCDSAVYKAAGYDKLLKYRKLRNYGNLFFFNHAPLSVKSYAITKYIIVIILKFFSIHSVVYLIDRCITRSFKSIQFL